jgi:hypothetical protein
LVIQSNNYLLDWFCFRCLLLDNISHQKNSVVIYSVGCSDFVGIRSINDSRSSVSPHIMHVDTDHHSLPRHDVQNHSVSADAICEAAIPLLVPVLTLVCSRSITIQSFDLQCHHLFIVITYRYDKQIRIMKIKHPNT